MGPVDILTGGYGLGGKVKDAERVRMAPPEIETEQNDKKSRGGATYGPEPFARGRDTDGGGVNGRGHQKRAACEKVTEVADMQGGELINLNCV
jgi:hypothetical protein